MYADEPFELVRAAELGLERCLWDEEMFCAEISNCCRMTPREHSQTECCAEDPLVKLF